MSIKGKLLSILVFICSTFALLSGVMIWSYMANYRQIQIAGAAIDDLYAVARVRAAINTQIAESMDYFISGRGEEIKEYEDCEVHVRKAHSKWIAAIEKSMILKPEDTEEMELARRVERKYNKLIKTIGKAIALTRVGEKGAANNLLENDVEPWINDVLYEEIDEALASEIKELDEAYDEVYMRLGSIPWAVAAGVRQLKLARFYVQYFLIIDKRLASNSRQFKKLTDYLVSGEELDREGFKAFGVDARRALKNWIKATEKHAEVLSEGERESLNNKVRDAQNKHSEFLTLANKSIELKQTGGTEEAAKLLEEKLGPFVDHVLLPKILEEIDQAKEKIDNTHNELLDTAFAAGLKNIFLLVIISLISVVVINGILRGIIISLDKLRMGTEIIGRGMFDHRIGITAKDEIGQLASSFDMMAESLQKSRDEIVSAHKYTDNILRSMSDMLCVVSPNGIIQTVNDAISTLLGYAKEELVGQPADMIFVEGLPIRKLVNADVVETDVIRSVENTYRAKDSRQIPVSFSSAVMRNEAGGIAGVVCVAQDFTKHKQMEESLRESRSKFQRLSQEFHALLDAIPDAFLLLNSNLEVQWANQGDAAVFGQGSFELTGQYCYALRFHRSSPCEDCLVLKSFRSGKEEDAQVSTHAGKFWDTRAIPIKGENGRIDNVIYVVVDITEKITLQADAMHAAHLASLGELAAGVAHEVNNPINSIINYAQILVDELSAERTHSDIANRILKDSDRIANIVRALLSFARSSDDEKIAVHINDLLSNSLALTEAQVRKDGIKLKTDIPPELPEIIAHPQQIEQIFLNFINNSRYALNEKYPGMHEDKVLEIIAEKAIIKDRPFVRVTFCDRGSGIPADVLNKVTDPFFSTKPKGVGTGLGLSISHGIISDHGGKLTIDSIEGKTTKIVVDLPAWGGG